MSRAALTAARMCLSATMLATTVARAYQNNLAQEAQRAKAAMLSQHYSEAAAIYRRMAAELPREPGIRFNLALALHSLGRYRESTQTLEGIRDAQASNPKFWFLLGEGYLNLKQAHDAVDPLTHAAALDPDSIDTNMELAAALLEDGQFSKSEERFRALSRDHPELPKVWAGLSLSQSGMAKELPGEAGGAYLRAAKESTARLSSVPESAERHEMLARLYNQAGQRTEAVAELKIAEKLSPGNPAIKSALAQTLIANREFDHAAATLRTLVAGSPDNSGWQFDLGDALLQSGNTNEAIDHLRRAVQISPSLLPAQAKLGEALLRAGSIGSAVAHLELAAPIDQDGSIHFQLATAYRRLGKKDLAERAMARRLELQSKAKPSP